MPVWDIKYQNKLGLHFSIGRSSKPIIWNGLIE